MVPMDILILANMFVKSYDLNYRYNTSIFELYPFFNSTLHYTV